MIWLAVFILIFTAVQLAVAMINLFTGMHLPRTDFRHDGKVSVLIPARNEEKNIGNLLEQLRRVLSGNMEVIVFSDQSEDRTAEIVRETVASDHRFRLIDSNHLPPGWLGKNYACHSLAFAATGDYLLFLDADVHVSGNIAGDAVSYALHSGSDLVSVFPMQEIITPGEWFSVPNMNYILVSLLPLFLVRHSPFPSLAAANGQFMLFNAKTYREIMPHKTLKDSMVEDILTARLYKKRGKTVSCMLGDERISCRMYSGFRDSVNGFSKNVTEFFGGSFLAASLFWIITTFGFVIIALYLPFIWFAAYIFMYLAARIAISLSGRQSVMKNLLCILPLQVAMGLFIVKSLTIKISKSYSWKGRNTG